MLSTDRSVNSAPASEPPAEPEVQHRILDAARQRFATQGYAGTSVRLIAADAGVTKPMVYYYFGSKEGLFRALIDDVYDHASLRMQDGLADDGGTPRDRLLRLARLHTEFMQDHGDTLRLMMQSMTQSQPQQAPTVDLDRFHALYIGAIRSALRPAAGSQPPSEAEIELFAAVFHGAMSAIQCSPQRPTSPDLPERMIDLLWFGAERALGGEDASR